MDLLKETILEKFPLFMELTEDADQIIELEVKYTTKGSSGVPKGVRESIENMLQEHNYTPFTSNTEDIFIDGERYTRQDDNSTTRTTKKNLLCMDLSSVADGMQGVKMTLSSEDNLLVTGENLYLESGRKDFHTLSQDSRDVWNNKAYNITAKWGDDGFRRKKKRKTYIYSQYTQIDITDITTIDSKYASYTKSEIEVELLGDITLESLSSFADATSYVSNLINMSYVIKDYNEWATLQSEYVRENYRFLTGKASTQPRNFKPDDFVWGGLLPSSEDDVGIEYSVTTKSDGVRRNLVVHSSGLWIVKPQRGFPVMYRVTPSITKKDKLYQYIGTIIDGEYIYNDEVSTFIPFDCMSYKKSSKSQGLNHIISGSDSNVKATRMGLAKMVCEHIDNDKLDFYYKKFYMLGNDFSSMYKSIKHIVSTETPFGTDGYIFTPNNFRYKTILSMDEKKYGDRRTLLDTPDILKLKPWDMLSIDFIIKNGKAYSINVVTKSLELFKGTKLTPFTEDNIGNIEEDLEGIVIELVPSRDNEGNIVMEFSRIRDDKDAPNSTKVAESVWKDLHQPIYTDSLLGKDFKMMRLFNNQVKVEMMKKFPTGTNLLDIGSGRGADLNKWDRYGIGQVLAVEPNEDNLSEFRRRLAQINFSNKQGLNDVLSIQSGGENTNYIVEQSKEVFRGDRDLVIVNMLSLSFFWSDVNMLKSLARTIVKVYKSWDESVKKLNNGVNDMKASFEFFTIEGERTKSVFIKKGKNRIHIGPVEMELKNGGVIEIIFPDTIVGVQTEWLVKLDILEKMIKMYLPSSSRMIIEDLDTSGKRGQYILSEQEKKFSSMYVVGSMKLN